MEKVEKLMNNAIDTLTFNNLLKNIIEPQEGANEFLYDVYTLCVDSINELNEASLMPTALSVNHMELIFYIVGEYLYSTSSRKQEEIIRFLSDENIKMSMASVVADKYISLSAFNYRERKLGNRFLPPISSLNLYLNFMLNILKNYKKSDPKLTLVTDLLMKSVSYASSISLLLVNGFETQAFATWRTLHECECSLVIIEKYEKECLETYLKHMRYASIFRKGHSDTKEEEDIFNQMKEEMKEKGLKSKDIKKYIEYGWLYAVPGVKEDETFKLNFRDGLEKVASLQLYSDRYEASSEIIHSTPILIYSNKDYYYFLTLISLYESFFKLEKVFYNLFASKVEESYIKAYEEMKKVYYLQLINIYKREVNNFTRWQKRLAESINKKEN